MLVTDIDGTLYAAINQSLTSVCHRCLLQVLFSYSLSDKPFPENDLTTGQQRERESHGMIDPACHVHTLMNPPSSRSTSLCLPPSVLLSSLPYYCPLSLDIVPCKSLSLSLVLKSDSLIFLFGNCCRKKKMDGTYQ